MLICLTASHHNASFEVLEKLSVAAPSVAGALMEQNDFIAGAVVLATGNRFEAYLDVEEPLTAARALAVEATVDVVSGASGIARDDVRGSVDVKCGDAVAEHLFAVSSGLESVVVGEGEIAGQVRRALEGARTGGTTSTGLERLFQTASNTSRGVKTRTGLQSAGRSMVRLALDLAESRIADWSATRVLLVGTGAYAGASLAALRDRGVVDVHVYSPSGRAQKFAGPHGIPAVEGRDLLRSLAASDMVVTCSTAPTAVLAAHHMQGAAAVSGDGRRRLVIDLGLPRNVDPDVVTVDGVELLDLETISLHAPLRDLTATDDAREIVSTAAAEFRAASAEDEVAPAVVALRTHIFDVLEGELERVRKRGDSSDATEKALRHLVSVLVHQPSVRARELARQGEGARVVDAVQALFGLDVEMPAAVSSPVAVALSRTAEAGQAS